MKKVTGKRVIAYILDYLIVAMIASLFARVPILNPQYDEYMKEYEKYTELLKNNLEKNATPTDKEETTEKVDEVVEEVKEDEVKELTPEMINEISYNLAKKGVNINIITIVVSIIYFVGFQFINKGQTLGKKICKIKMIDVKEDKLKIQQVLLNSAIINSLITSTISILLILYVKQDAYFKYNEILQLVETGILLSSLAFMVMRNDGKGLHDLIANTNVVSEVQQ